MVIILFFFNRLKSEISKGFCGAPARSRTADLLITNQQTNKISFHKLLILVTFGVASTDLKIKDYKKTTTEKIKPQSINNCGDAIYNL